MKILTIIGARPQFIKAAVVSSAIVSSPDASEVIVHTGQHFDDKMSAVFFDQLGIPKPAYTLGIHSLQHGAMTGRMLESIEEVLTQEKPDWVLVYGDTNSTLAGALAAAKMHIPVAHVEAGLRSFNRKMPEEINRIVTDHVSDLLFAPTPMAFQNLQREGINESVIVTCGDVMYDCALRFGNLALSHSNIVEDLGCTEKGFILCTAHRAENTDDPRLLATLFEALEALATELPVVMPVHPRTRKFAQDQGLSFDKILAIDPVGYLDMLRLEKSAALIMTDSGGVQKEAYFHQVPCVTLRPQTEWVELIEVGWNVLCPLEEGAENLTQTVRDRLATKGKSLDVYGDGTAAIKIVAAMVAKR